MKVIMNTSYSTVRLGRNFIFLRELLPWFKARQPNMIFLKLFSIFSSETVIRVWNVFSE